MGPGNQQQGVGAPAATPPNYVPMGGGPTYGASGYPAALPAQQETFPTRLLQQQIMPAMQFQPGDELEWKMKARVIDDLLQGLIKRDEPGARQYKSSDSLPDEWFIPVV